MLYLGSDQNIILTWQLQSRTGLVTLSGKQSGRQQDKGGF